MPKIYAAGDQLSASEYNEVVKTAGLYAASSAGSDSYAITVTPAPGSYAAGDVFRFKADVANTGSATLNVNTLGAKTIKRIDATDLQTGDILASQFVEVIYDGTNFQLISANFGVIAYLATASATQQYAADTERTTTATSYGMAKQITIRYGGTVRVTFDQKGSASFGYAQIYVNDIAVGSERVNSDNAYHSYSEDITIKPFDKVQLFYKSSSGVVTSYVRNFRVLFDLSATEISGVVNTD